MGANHVRLDTSLEKVLERAALVGGPAVLATIVATAGATYRKPGARMLIEPDGRITGLLSGGCLENDLSEHAFRVLADGAARAMDYDMRNEDDLIFGMGAGCEGMMRILLEPVERGGTTLSLLKAMERSHEGEPVALASVHVGRGSPQGTRVSPADDDAFFDAPLARACQGAISDGISRAFSWHSGLGENRAWIQVLQPPPRVLLCGAGPDAEPLVEALHALRFLVSVVDHRPAYVDARRFPGARVLLADATTWGELSISTGSRRRWS